MKLTDVRSVAYTVARRTGDYEAVTSGSPTKIVKRLIRKSMGRKYGSIMGRLLR